MARTLLLPRILLDLRHHFRQLSIRPQLIGLCFEALALKLRPIQRHVPKLHQPLLLAQSQHLHKQPLQRLQML